MTNTALNTNLRNSLMKDFMEFIATKYDVDVLSVSSSSVAFPVVDEEGNEKFAKVSISIPRGTRNGKGSYDEYDAYTVAEDFKLEQEEKEAKRKASEAKKEAKRKADEEKRATKKAIKNLENAISES